MFLGRKLNRKINHIRERSLLIVYRDYNSSFSDLLKKDKSVCIHHRNIHSSDVELFKKKDNFSSTIISDIFTTRVLNYKLGSQIDFFRNTVNTTKLGFNSSRYFALKICSMIPVEIKNPSSA